jgi:hypothetical protein
VSLSFFSAREDEDKDEDEDKVSMLFKTISPFRNQVLNVIYL